MLWTTLMNTVAYMGDNNYVLSEPLMTALIALL